MSLDVVNVRITLHQINFYKSIYNLSEVCSVVNSDLNFCCRVFVPPCFAFFHEVNMILTSLWFLLILHKFLPDAAEKLAVAGVCGLCSVVFLLRVRERDNKHFSVAFQGKSFTRHLPTSQSISQKNSAMPPLSQVMLPRARVCGCVCFGAGWYTLIKAAGVREWISDLWDAIWEGIQIHVTLLLLHVWRCECTCVFVKREKERESWTHL